VPSRRADVLIGGRHGAREAVAGGTDTTGGEHTLLFSAGVNDETDGLVGSINHVS
jgi:hypothetical protein